MHDLRYWLALNAIYGLGTQRMRLLLRRFGSPKATLEAPYKQLKEVPGIGGELAGRTANWNKYIDLEKEFALIEKHKVKVIIMEDKSYPQLLSKIFDPPLVLYVKGEFLPADQVPIAIVGSRRPSIYGRMTAERLGRELAGRGLTVVSGMARGIDSAAHKGALAAKGRTIAVLGSGLDVVYPPENKNLMEEISKSGAVISEFPMSTKPDRGNFPKRNRIISGLSLGVVVVEAAQRSGALITVDCALEQGREVFALPGKIDSVTSQGTNRLIQQGAKLVATGKDIIEELEPIMENLQVPATPGEGTRAESKRPGERNAGKLPPPPLKENEKKVYELLSDEPRHIDTLIQESRLPASKVSATLLMLQIKKFVKELPGKMFMRA
ncbi:DNA-processing protein DprA [bacterium]|nr:DNA-processing protein DprA [bacterium]